jgi:hypothetical protein
MSNKRMGSCGLLVILLSLSLAWAQNPVQGGNLRSASIAWVRTAGNEVEFEIQAEWRRSFEGHYKNGSSANGAVFAGDLISIGGTQSPRLLFGDGTFSYLVLFSLALALCSITSQCYCATCGLSLNTRSDGKADTTYRSE